MYRQGASKCFGLRLREPNRSVTILAIVRINANLVSDFGAIKVILFQTLERSLQ